jgi:hypothetical protein
LNHPVSVQREPVSASGMDTSAALVDYFRCPPGLVTLDTSSALKAAEGYFRFTGLPAEPFDLTAAVGNLREERYLGHGALVTGGATSSTVVEWLYYCVRPLLPVRVRRHLQKIRLDGWERLTFPRWPVDTTVDDLMWEALLSGLLATADGRVPFFWFGADGARGWTMVARGGVVS